MAKKANHAGGLDRISNLPDSVLIRILSLLPIKYAVSTSILSTRWRFLFASVFNLNVSCNLDWSSPPTVYSFREFMNKMLFFLTEGRIEQLRLIHLDTSSRIDYLPVSGWISAALWRGVMELDLCSSNTLIALPAGLLFSSKTLVRLKLEIPILISVPTCAFLPSLKTLKLQDITFEDDDSVKRLISRSPILEDLSISNCDMQNITCLTISNPSLKSLTLDFDTDFPDYKFAVAIDLPTLVYFKYCDNESQNFSIVDVPSLVTADIDISTIHDQPGLVELFEGIRNVKSLHLIIYPEALPILSHKCFVALENLVQLQIYDTENEWKGMGLFEFDNIYRLFSVLLVLFGLVIREN